MPRFAFIVVPFAISLVLFLTFVYPILAAESSVTIPDAFGDGNGNIRQNPLAFIYSDRDGNSSVVFDAGDVRLEGEAHAIFQAYTAKDGTENVRIVTIGDTKIDELLLDESYLEKEGYVKDGKVPVIISLNVEKFLEEEPSEQPSGQIEQRQYVLPIWHQPIPCSQKST